MLSFVWTILTLTNLKAALNSKSPSSVQKEPFTTHFQGSFRSELGIARDINQIPPLPLHFTAEKTEAPERPRVRTTPNSRTKDRWEATTESKTSNEHLKI